MSNIVNILSGVGDTNDNLSDILRIPLHQENSGFDVGPFPPAHGIGHQALRSYCNTYPFGP